MSRHTVLSILTMPQSSISDKHNVSIMHPPQKREKYTKHLVSTHVHAYMYIYTHACMHTHAHTHRHIHISIMIILKVLVITHCQRAPWAGDYKFTLRNPSRDKDDTDTMAW